MKAKDPISLRFPLWILLLIIAAVNSGFAIAADDGDGNEYDPDYPYPGRYDYCPIRINVPEEYFEISDSVNTENWTWHQSQVESVHYTFSLSIPMRVMITTLGSELERTKISVYAIMPDSSLRPIEEPADTMLLIRNIVDAGGWNYDLYTQTQSISRHEWLRPGDYMAVVSGLPTYYGSPYKANGGIRTTFIGTPQWEDSVLVPSAYLAGTRHWPEYIAPGGETDIIREMNALKVNARRQCDSTYYFRIRQKKAADITLIPEPGLDLRMYAHGAAAADTLCSEGDSIRTVTLPGEYVIEATFGRAFRPGDSIVIHSRFNPPPAGYDYITYDDNVAGHNYVAVRTMLNASGSDYTESASHHDGLGRPVQQILRGASPSGADLVTLTEYDNLGREARLWLPAPASGSGSAGYCHDGELSYESVYPSERAPYSFTYFDTSNLRRHLRDYGPGKEWHHARAAVHTEYLVNSASDAALQSRCYTFAQSPTRFCAEIRSPGNYPAGQLTAIRTTDEDGNVSIEFTDARGLTVLHRRMTGDGSMADTYYVYDDLWNLAAVLPPEAATRMSGQGTWNVYDSEVVRQYCYVYLYTNFNARNPSYILLPGQEETYASYDATDQAVLTRDGNMKDSGRFLLSAPDIFGRPALRGFCAASGYASLPETPVVARRAASGAAADSTLMGYSLTGIAVNDPQILEVTYYDDYSFIGHYGAPGSDRLGFAAKEGFQSTPASAKGLATGGASALTDTASAGTAMLFTAIYYDDLGRELQRVSTNHLGGTDRVTTAYDFRGLPVRTLREHSVPGKPAVSELMESEYDRQGRHLRTTYSINGTTARTLRADSYDELGRLDRTLLHGSETMAVSYGYDVRSRPESMRSDVYSQTLSFTPSGIVSRKEWKANGPSESRRSYDYTYNGLGFLTRARYDDASGGADNFTVDYSYDLQGNLLTVERRGRYDDHPRHNLIDDMTYEYSGNQLTRISDAQPGPYTYNTVTFRDDADLDTEFTYDGCGNMTSDLNRGVTAISYQPSTGRPVEIRTSAGAVTRHLRDAAGNRLRSVRTLLSQTPEAPALELLLTGANSQTDSTVTDRVEGRYVYEEGELVRIEHADGYIDNPLAEEPDYRYFVRDHTGSNVAVTGTPHGGSYQINHYYPFGMPLGCDYCPWVQDRKFGGKELDRVSGLNLMDFEERIYDPTTGRFYTPDPLSHINYPLSPYAYCANSPISHSDPTGMKGVRIINDDEKTVTITATYFVITGNLEYYDNGNIRELKGYNDADISEMNKYSDLLNDLNLSIDNGEYSGYSLRFNLKFVNGGESYEAEESVQKEMYDNILIGNTLEVRSSKTFKGFREEIKNGIHMVAGGVTEYKSKIVMNKPYDSTLNRLHEIFHTFGFNDIEPNGANQGIMHYPPKTPTNKDAEILMNLNYLPIIFKK